MTSFPVTITALQIGPHYIQICQPPADLVKDHYELQKQKKPDLLPPYWAKIWPSAIAISKYLVDHSSLLLGKRVVELAAGLGLPSFLAAHYARSVIVSDYIIDAKYFQDCSIEKNNLENVTAAILDWRSLPADLEADLFLLSDSNYDPRNQEELLFVISSLVNRGSDVLLATPQRLLSRNFVSELLQDAYQTEEIAVETESETVSISRLLLEGK